MSLFLDLLSSEKAAAIQRGERVEITGEESKRFQLACERAHEPHTCRTPCLFRDAETHSALARVAELGQECGELASMVAKLARNLQKAAPDHALPERAFDYLKRHNRQGSPLR